jgi:alkanesulfonate monooxygenase SsuD/methylene tetrahydromethanopterin reductase-like flavin-dependent oxidoreductase (luciferase family)
VDVRFGVHAGLQNTSIAELQALWRRIEELGFDWISIWDHFYAADATGNPHCLEAIATHAALASTTERVLCGSLVYSAGYRHPAVLANSMATLDQIAAGRIVLGLGGGWLEQEYDVYGLHYGSPGERLRMLNEYIQCVRGLLTQHRTDFSGEFFSLRDAACEPKPVQERLPIWVGGGGEKVTLRIVAEYGDYANIDGSPEGFAHKSEVLAGHCRDVGRDFDSIVRSANYNVVVGETEKDVQDRLAWIEDSYRKAGLTEAGVRAQAQNFRSGPAVGTPEQIVETLRGLEKAGMTYCITNFREAAYDTSGMELFESAVIPELRGS